MVRFIMVKPIGDQVVLGQDGMPIPIQGKRVQDDQYWYRMERRGAVDISPDEQAAPIAAKKSKPIKEGGGE